MSFDAKMQVTEGVATIRLSGELNSGSAQKFNELITDATSQQIRELVLLAEDLTYMSSAGLRSLVFAHQRMPRGTKIVLIGAQPDVAKTVTLTGFDRSIDMQEAAKTQ
jgi:anti-sigma B factor antagonist